jgi:penicillin-binding protein 2
MRKDKYASRKYTIYGFFVFIGILFLIRLSILQLSNNEYAFAAENNTRRDITIYSPRGLIYDRNGKLVVYNEAVFDLMIVPTEVKNIDVANFSKLLGIDTLEYHRRYKKAKNYSSRKASIFVKQLSKKQTAFLQEKLFQFPGFYVQARTLRKYPYHNAAHLLGYVGEVNNKELENDTFYTSGDYIGKSGIEKSYEKHLRGEKGVEKLMVDVYNREKGSFHNGKYDIPAKKGENLHLGLDVVLQAYGEELMRNKIGAIVAIEPATGEIISMVSAPNYDPNLLVGRIRSHNYDSLLHNNQKPLITRALNSSYPPGSTFKLVQALIAQQERVLYPSTTYTCHNGFNYNGLHVGCHSHTPTIKLEEAIKISCNAYFCNVYRSIIDNHDFANAEMGFRKWRDYTLKMGFGRRLGIDLPYERGGNIPKPEYYDKYYGKGHWNAITTISLAIGQGEILETPLQMANEAAWIANRGYYYTPHIVAQIGDTTKQNPYFTDKNYVGIERKYFNVVVDGMEKVVESGTAKLAKIDSISVCGKTGTAQNPHGENHSAFIAFAPKDNPQIAIAVFVENSGYGGTWAAPIASLMIEKYLKGYIPKKRKWLEKRILEGNLIPTDER